MEKKLHTPEGVRDIYNSECQKKLALQEILLHNLHLFGYQDIQTPTFEYMDVFRKEVGSIPINELYKFFDNEGNILALRPDITPSVARAAATLFQEEQMPSRLCYVGNTFANYTSYQGHLKESTQLGAELIGDNSIEADAEMIAMMVEGLLKTGLTEFQVNVGHVDFIKSLLNGTKLEEEQLNEIRSLLGNKNYFGIEDILEQHQVSNRVIAAFRALPDLNGGYEILGKAAELSLDNDAKLAVIRLLKIYSLLTQYGVEKYIHFDLSTSGRYGYYSGIVFRAYTYGIGDAVARGGRYDQMLGIFGKHTPSIGFAIIVDNLLHALDRQKIEIAIRETNLIVYYEENKQQAIVLAQDFRKKGKCVELLKREPDELLETFVEYGKRSNVASTLLLEKDGTMKMLDPDTGEEHVIGEK